MYGAKHGEEIPFWGFFFLRIQVAVLKNKRKKKKITTKGCKNIALFFDIWYIIFIKNKICANNIHKGYI